MYYSIAVYPHKGAQDERAQWQAYMDRAVRQGFQEVFLSLHLPEFSLEEQLSLLEELSEEARKRSMCLTVDVGGRQIAELLEKEEYCGRMRRAAVDFIRLDYGFSMEQAKRIWRKWQVKGFVINASIFGEATLRELKQGFCGIDSAVELRACHNYYPRPESGLSYEFFIKQNALLKELGIPVYSCIPDREHARGPLGEGLPTVEAHRFMDLEQVVRQLAASPGNEGLMAADEYFSEEKLGRIRRAAEEQRGRIGQAAEGESSRRGQAAEGEPDRSGQAAKNGGCLNQAAEAAAPRIETLSICWEDGVSEEEKQIVCGRTHHIRYDSNEWLLRSQSSREMSEYAGAIAPRLCAARRRGMVTIDNTNYGRYSGELQIVMADLPKDGRVNAVGTIAAHDLWKLAHYREGVDYRFEAAGTLRLLRDGDTEEAVALWNRSLPYCPIDAKEWAGVVLADENRDPQLCLAVEQDGKLRAVAVGAVRRYPYLERGREEERAWILALAVDPLYRGKGLGGHLLRELERRFAARGCTRITIAAYSPNYFTAGIHESETIAMEWLERRGYVRGEAAYWMERKLDGYELPAAIAQRREKLRAEGFAFVPYDSRWAGQLLTFLRENFSTGWRVHVMRAMQLKRLEGHCILCCRAGRVVGYVQRGAGGDECRFGPFGVAADCRNHGLGAVLLHLMWESMAKEGLASVYFRSTEENGRRLYERQGMQVKEVYYHFEKPEAGLLEGGMPAGIEG